MDVTLKGNTLTIVAELDKEGRPSSSGKTRLHASTNGAKQTDVKVNGQNLTVNLNAYTFTTPKKVRTGAETE